MLRLEVAVGPQEFHDKLKKIGGLDNVKEIYYLDRLLRLHGYKFDDGFNDNIYLFICREHDQLPSGQEPEQKE